MREWFGGWGWLLCGLALVGAGCSKGDTERLGRVGRKILVMAADLSADTNDRLHTGWQSLRANLDESGLDARVTTRLRWDKGLADVPIEVVALPDNGVELKGAVENLDQRRRAVGLAETTLGVERVVDSLEVPGAGQ
jgi:osmotically-inducible protein OsmY